MNTITERMFKVYDSTDEGNLKKLGYVLGDLDARCFNWPRVWRMDRDVRIVVTGLNELN